MKFFCFYLFAIYLLNYQQIFLAVNVLIQLSIYFIILNLIIQCGLPEINYY